MLQCRAHVELLQSDVTCASLSRRTAKLLLSSQGQAALRLQNVGRCLCTCSGCANLGLPTGKRLATTATTGRKRESLPSSFGTLCAAFLRQKLLTDTLA